jgi:tetratricopeptide (TPR) repeat protein
MADREEARRLSPEAYAAWTESGPAEPAVVTTAAPKPQPVKAAVAEPKPAPPPAVDTPVPANPESADAHYQRGRDLVYKARYAEGMAELNQALSMQPQNPIYYNTRGFGYYVSKDYKRAIADFNEALRLDPDYLNAQHNLALAYKNSGDEAAYNAARQRELALGKKLRIPVK